VVAFKIDTFGGMVPAVDDRLLPDKSAALAKNDWVYPGTLKGVPTPKLLRAVTTGTNKVFRLPNNFTDTLHLDDSHWMEFPNIDTDVIRGNVIGDTYDRYYWATPADVPRYNTRARIVNGDASYKLGIPTPATAPGVVASGGVGLAQARAYVYTWVSTFGEEGPPSPPTLVNGKIDDTWALTATAPTGADTTGRTLASTRFYRTVTAVDGTTTYFLVREQAIASLTYNDTIPDTTIVANVSLVSTNWSAPPTDLQGWVTAANGIVAGWRENELWFAEPFRPHAWPVAYVVVTEFPIVGLGVVNNALIVMTEGNPYIATGVHPASVSLARLDAFAPCLSRGSIVVSNDGVRYASNNGMMLVGNGQVANATRAIITPEKWRALTELPTLRAAKLGTAYYAFGSARQGVFEPTAFDVTGRFTDTDFSGSYDGFYLDVVDTRISFHELEETVPTTNIFNDVWSGELFMIRSGNLYWLDIADIDQSREPYLWRSKIFQTPLKKGFAAFKIYFEVPEGTPAQNPVRVTNQTTLETLASDQYGIVRIYADGVFLASYEIRTSGEQIRIPSGRKADFWQFEIEARVEILSLQFATAAKELAGV
jgi:hypothetical protein